MARQTIVRNNSGRSKPANFRLDEKLLDELRETAERASMSQAVIVSEGIRLKLKEYERTGRIALAEGV